MEGAKNQSTHQVAVCTQVGESAFFSVLICHVESREQNKALQVFERLTREIVVAFEGKADGEADDCRAYRFALLGNSIRAAMAIQDKVVSFNLTQTSGCKLRVSMLVANSDFGEMLPSLSELHPLLADHQILIPDANPSNKKIAGIAVEPIEEEGNLDPSELKGFVRVSSMYSTSDYPFGGKHLRLPTVEGAVVRPKFWFVLSLAISIIFSVAVILGNVM